MTSTPDRYLIPRPRGVSWAVGSRNDDIARRLILDLKPKKTILTHFGLSMLKARPNILAKQLSWETGLNVVAATDGLTVPFEVSKPG